MNISTNGDSLKSGSQKGPILNDFVLNVATVNGSGSQSANNILLKSLFRMGLPVGGKNLFPSNIAGLPTWFSIRVNHQGFTAKGSRIDIVVAMNPQTIVKDMNSVAPGGVFIYNSDLKLDPKSLREDLLNLAIPFRELVGQLDAGIKIKKLLTNMIYVGVLGQLLKIDKATLISTIADQFSGKDSVIEINQKATEVGWQFAAGNLQTPFFPYEVTPLQLNKGKILIDGNSAAALGLIFGGCSFVSWYPITPSSSLVESFINYAQRYRKDPDGKNTFAVVQAEDELSSITMVLGAGWSGARAITATSGPGLSLMSEAAGFAYYAEIPSVIWDVQRVGPSTGMPTRTQQGDIMAAAQLSHGDTRHILLLPSNPSECFEFGQTCLDLAERLQTLVLVMSDLDIGMNFWIVDDFTISNNAFDRGKVLDATTLSGKPNYGRFIDDDDDGIPYRSLPGTHHPKSAYLTRGSGHNKTANYTEDPFEYQELVDRIAKKFETAKTLVPSPIVELVETSKVGLIAYGSTDIAMVEARNQLYEQYQRPTSYMRLRAFPFHPDVERFIDSHEEVYVIDQNREGQMRQLLCRDFPHLAPKLKGIRHYNGQPIEAAHIIEPIVRGETH